MFASHNRLNNLILIVDMNGISMLDYCKNTLNLEPLDEKFKSFGWEVESVDGHNVESLYLSLSRLNNSKSVCPKVLIAKTKKGKGIPSLETDSLCHIRSLERKEALNILRNL
jgi:transketolase